MRARLIAAARPRFAAHGYAASATESILEAAGATRGALYHHFTDKSALFAAVCEQLAADACAAIEAAAKDRAPFEALLAGSLAWVEFMMRPEAQRILLVDGPTVLGWKRWSAIDEAYGAKRLREGVEAARAAGALRFAGDPEAFVAMLNGALNALALKLANDAPSLEEHWRESVEGFLYAFQRRTEADKAAEKSAQKAMEKALRKAEKKKRKKEREKEIAAANAAADL
jgi:AcrR family transcriptional regulator